ncbi:hybrid nucleoside-diphosphate sugar epimerase/sugar transferase [Mesorhizobium sp.]|uniref:hybrid nucleoside-diphosphate sugar epimerase/sugar transferase n=1 Tax=Mesorhizobium sp. TaxID=1871066 RepID=UPI000FE9F852|nr:hybrid nucleoside-diphosphate sugar epimerase/sugar transferase [Mesorhizobium sp.]RWO82890.1 MAG: NAD-dependent epimerase/dehydratase family protein [Mesorhizobium sp.]
MRVAITGASGFVGRHLVPLLKERGAELLLIGRDSARLEQMFPGASTCTYDELPVWGIGYDTLVHLAVLNNTALASKAEFIAVNVELMVDTVAAARQASIPHFINVSSVHALDPLNTSKYAYSKRVGVECLRLEEGITITTVYLPFVYSKQWSGRLNILNRLPDSLASMLFILLQSLKPAVNVETVAKYIVGVATTERESEIILSDTQEQNLFFTVCKRTMDLSFALGVGLLFWWVFLIISVLIRIQSEGPAIFAQERVGLHGRSFTCYKFRTMKLGTTQAGTHEVSASSITSLGGVLRRTKLDELPQIWNIIRNETSLVGPRPCLPVQTELIEARKRRGVLNIKPGITGLAQINNIDMSDPEKLASWDQRYVALQALLLDLRIILATAIGKGRGDRVNTETA